MRERLFILTNDPVPYGTANSNYIRNFANAVSMTGMSVIVIGMKNASDQLYLYCSEKSETIQYWNLNETKEGAKNYLRVYFNYKKKYTDILKKFDAGKNDYIVVYSTEMDTAKAAIMYKRVPLNHKAFCEVEWFQPYQYKRGKLSSMYILWRIGFGYRMKTFAKAIPISESLDDLFKKKGCLTIIVPALVDTSDMRAQRKIDGNYVHFIYPGSASDKDSFPCMINAFASLDMEEMNRVRFHLTGNMTLDKLKNMVGIEEGQLKKIKSILVFHGWLDYDELMDLYGKTDYLLLARPKNIVTLSNFPSKVPEMLNYGVVPVCSAVGDYTDKYLVDDVDSIQFVEDNVESCREAIIKAIRKKDAGLLPCMQFAARKTAVEKLDYRNWGQIIVDFMKK